MKLIKNTNKSVFNFLIIVLITLGIPFSTFAAKIDLIYSESKSLGYRDFYHDNPELYYDWNLLNASTVTINDPNDGRKLAEANVNVGVSTASIDSFTDWAPHADTSSMMLFKAIDSSRMEFSAYAERTGGDAHSWVRLMDLTSQQEMLWMDFCETKLIGQVVDLDFVDYKNLFHGYFDLDSSHLYQLTTYTGSCFDDSGWSNASFSLIPVPETGTFLLLCFGLVPIIWIRRK